MATDEPRRLSGNSRPRSAVPTDLSTPHDRI